MYFKAADEDEEGEWLLAADILQRIQKASKMKFSPGHVNYFGCILRKLGVESLRKTHGSYYHVVKNDADLLAQVVERGYLCSD